MSATGSDVSSSGSQRGSVASAASYMRSVRASTLSRGTVEGLPTVPENGDSLSQSLSRLKLAELRRDAVAKSEAGSVTQHRGALEVVSDIRPESGGASVARSVARSESRRASVARSQARPESSADSVAQSEARSKSRASIALAESYISSFTQCGARPESHGDSVARSQAHPESGAESIARSKARSESRRASVARSETRPESDAESVARSQARPESGAESVARSKARSESCGDSVARSKARPKTRKAPIARTKARLESPRPSAAPSEAYPEPPGASAAQYEERPVTQRTTDPSRTKARFSQAEMPFYDPRQQTSSTVLTNVMGPNRYGRYNLSCCSQYYLQDVENPFAEGEFRFVAKSVYREGVRAGSPCIIKWFKSGHVFDDTFFELDIHAVDKALELVERFNAAQIITKEIRVNVPAVWTCINGPWEDRKLLAEPHIEHYEKFNSNSGWSKIDQSHDWGQVMQALSHFTYHVTGGRYILCDLQGGVYQHSIVITDPVILSLDREYGATDLGEKGMSHFFFLHKCNRYCREEWAKPDKMVEWKQNVAGVPEHLQKSITSSSTTFKELPAPLPVATCLSRAMETVFE